MRIGLVTCSRLPEPDIDAQPLADAARDAGHEPVDVPWDAPDLPACEVYVLRSCWNYHEHPDAFRAWIDHVGASATLVNAPEVVRWNMDKRYLVEFAEAGLHVIPTRVVEDPATDTVDLQGPVVLKPVVGAASRDTKRFDDPDRARADLRRRTEPTLVQPVAPGFDDPGERSIIWIDGTWTHAVRKRPRYHGEDESVEASHPPTDDEIALGEAALAHTPGPLVYARLDVIDDAHGRPMLSEFEVIEPSLFFPFGPEAARRLVVALERHAP
ncbi:MAG: hypothetical protein KDA28_14135 [Phycisphaerales bacterium]|nr:hypothetical protein [Phycisphaerales bacterium]